MKTIARITKADGLYRFEGKDYESFLDARRAMRDYVKAAAEKRSGRRAFLDLALTLGTRNLQPALLPPAY